MKEQTFCICRQCGNLAGMLTDSGVLMVCCGENMERLVPNTVDAAAEKHVPHVTFDGDRVQVRVGSTAHPMTGEHFIEWIYLQTGHGGCRKRLEAGMEPAAVFVLEDQTASVTVFAYCNLHGLWKWESPEK